MLCVRKMSSSVIPLNASISCCDVTVTPTVMTSPMKCTAVSNHGNYLAFVCCARLVVFSSLPSAFLGRQIVWFDSLVCLFVYVLLSVRSFVFVSSFLHNLSPDPLFRIWTSQNARVGTKENKRLRQKKKTNTLHVYVYLISKIWLIHSFTFFFVFLPADLKEPNLTITTNSTSSTIIPSNLTTSPPTPPTNHNENTKPVLPKKRKEDKYTKDKKNRIYFDNNTKRKKKRQFYNKSSARTPIQSSITATDKTTSSEVQRNNIEAGGVTHCSVEECMKWKACWRDINSHECPCDEAGCRRGLKTSAYVGNENKRKTKGGRERSPL